MDATENLLLKSECKYLKCLIILSCNNNFDVECVLFNLMQIKQ